MTLVHVLGGVSLVVVVAVSSMVRTGLGVHAGEHAAMIGAGGEDVVIQSQMPARDEGVVPVAFGPLRNRMRP